MKKVGVVSQLFRYPVKSMGGERISQTEVLEKGFYKDRTWAIYDLERGEITGGKKVGKLMMLNAKYAADLNGTSPLVDLILPDGTTLSSADENCSEALSSYLGKKVELVDLKPASDRKHYRLAKMMNESEVRKILDLEEGEPVPDFSQSSFGLLAQLQIFATPPGTYFDMYPLHILTQNSLEHIRSLTSNDNYSVERFRPNMLIDAEEGAGFVEEAWCDHSLKIGDCIIEVKSFTPRCAMPGRAQAELVEDKTIPRQLTKFANRNLGVYCTVKQTGSVKEGDSVYLIENKESFLGAALRKGSRKIKQGIVKIAS